MNKRKKYKRLLAFASIFAMTMGMATTTYGAFRAMGETTNYISTADSYGSSIQEKYNPPETVLPGMYVDKIVNVKNVGDAPSVARVKLTKRFDDISLDPEMIILDIDTEHWSKHGDWWYYESELQGGESTEYPLLKGFTLSKDAGNSYQSQEGHIDVEVESLQYVGDILEDVWGIKYSEIGMIKPKDSYDKYKTKITFTGKEFKFKGREADDLFSNFKGLVANSERTQVIQVKNTSKSTVKIHLESMFSDDTSQALKDLMFRYVKITIKDKKTGKQLYKGNIGGKKEKTNITLGKYDPGESKDIIVVAKVDADLDNMYQNLEGSVDWMFMAEDFSDGSNNGGNPDGGGNSKGGNPKDKNFPDGGSENNSGGNPDGGSGDNSSGGSGNNPGGSPNNDCSGGCNCGGCSTNSSNSNQSGGTCNGGCTCGMSGSNSEGNSNPGRVCKCPKDKNGNCLCAKNKRVITGQLLAKTGDSNILYLGTGLTVVGGITLLIALRKGKEDKERGNEVEVH